MVEALGRYAQSHGITSRMNLDLKRLFIAGNLSVRLCLLFALGAAILSCARVREIRLRENTSAGSRYLVGAHYYLWYPENFSYGYLRDKLSPPQRPVLGRYNSLNVRAAEQHIAWASQYGIDFFTLDWWPSRPEQNKAVDRFLQAANLADIKFCIFYELWDLGFKEEKIATEFDKEAEIIFRNQMHVIADRFFSHPSYLKVDGRPVVILYLTRTLTGNYAEVFISVREELRSKGFDVFFIGDEIYWNVSSKENGASHTQAPQVGRIKLFDAITAYNFYSADSPSHAGYGAESSFIDDIRALYDSYRGAQDQSVPIVPSVIPGYNDRGVRPAKNHYIVPRVWSRSADEGSFFVQMVRRVVYPYIDPRLPMVLITSWNEWNEDTAIEPMQVAKSSSKDSSKSQKFFTDGYPYAGYGLRYLELVRDLFVSVSGRVLDKNGEPLSGMQVRAWSNGVLIDYDITDLRGYYTLSRHALPGGEYLIEAHGESKQVRVEPQRTIVDVDFEIL